MSLITRCPACQTLFKVVADQLRVSEGWVRCGQCNEIFDASLSLVSPAAPAPVQRTDLANADDSAGMDRVKESPPAPAPIVPETALADEPGESPEATEASVPRDLAGLAELEPERPAELSEVSFMRDEPLQVLRRKPLVQALGLLLGAILLLGLGGQILLHERDRIAALQPKLSPWLLALCRPLNCAVSPLQHKDAVVIDGASFTKIRPDAYRLNFTLKNTELIALAVPAIELTLTDSLDQPVIRRVFLAPELGLNGDTLAAASESSASLALAVRAAGTAERIVGYRLLAFYP